MEDTLLLAEADLAPVGILEHLFPALLLAEQRAAGELLLLVLLLGRDCDGEALAVPARPRADVLALLLCLFALGRRRLVLCVPLCRLLARLPLLCLAALGRLVVDLVRVVKLAEPPLCLAFAAHVLDLAPARPHEPDGRAGVGVRARDVADELRRRRAGGDRGVGGVAEDVERALLLVEREGREVLLLDVACGCGCASVFRVRLARCEQTSAWSASTGVRERDKEDGPVRAFCRSSLPSFQGLAGPCTGRERSAYEAL